MSDITDLFSRVAPTADADPTDSTIEADLARGRTALARDHRRRTIRRSMAATSTVAAAAVVIVVASQLSGGSGVTHHHQAATYHHTAPKPATHPSTIVKPHHHSNKPIKLVAYNGKQLSGFTVDEIPAGWFLGGVNQFALTINSKGDTNTDADVFEGKLTVLLMSKDETFPTHGIQVSGDGRDGIITDHGGIQLYFPDGAGHTLDIEVPNKLNWSDDQMVSFAEGVHVTGDALQGVG